MERTEEYFSYIYLGTFIINCRVSFGFPYILTWVTLFSLKCYLLSPMLKSETNNGAHELIC